MINYDELDEIISSFERVEGRVSDIILLGKQGGVRRIILSEESSQ